MTAQLRVLTIKGLSVVGVRQRERRHANLYFTGCSILLQCSTRGSSSLRDLIPVPSVQAKAICSVQVRAIGSVQVKAVDSLQVQATYYLLRLGGPELYLELDSIQPVLSLPSLVISLTQWAAGRANAEFIHWRKTDFTFSFQWLVVTWMYSSLSIVLSVFRSACVI